MKGYRFRERELSIFLERRIAGQENDGIGLASQDDHYEDHARRLRYNPVRRSSG